VIPGKKYGPEYIGRILWRRKWLLVAPMCIAAVGAAIYAHSIPDLYRSESLLMIVPQRVPESYVRATVTARVQDRMQAITQDLLSRTRLERIIEEFNLYARDRQVQSTDEIVDRMRWDIRVEPVKGDAFRLSYISTSAPMAMRVTERLTSLFIDEHLRERGLLADATSEFLETQLEEARQQLVEKEKKLEQYRMQHAGELPTEAGSNLSAMQNYEMRRQTLADSVARDRDRRLLLERTIADLKSAAPSPSAVDTSSPAPMPPVGGTAAEQVEAATRRLHELEVRFKPAHPDVVRMRAIVRELTAKAATGAAPRPDPITGAVPPIDNPAISRVRELEGEIANLDAQIAQKEREAERLRTASSEYQRRIEAAPRRESELLVLSRDHETLQRLYSSLLAKREDSKMAANLERRQVGEQFRIIDPARMATRPFSPDRERMIAIGAAAGLALGLALAVLLEYRDTSLWTDDDVVTCLSMPVLAIVPIVTTALERRQRIRRAAASWSLATGLMATAAVLLWKFRP
jgi:polysaccharide chain length determinant protein (PEP-CTERM system associated)